MTEWQLYAQKLEGSQWQGEKLDKSKLDKMSGTLFLIFVVLWSNRVTNYVNFAIDQQLGQLLELMEALKNDGEGEGK